MDVCPEGRTRSNRCPDRPPGGRRDPLRAIGSVSGGVRLAPRSSSALPCCSCSKPCKVSESSLDGGEVAGRCKPCAVAARVLDLSKRNGLDGYRLCGLQPDLLPPTAIGRSNQRDSDP